MTYPARLMAAGLRGYQRLVSPLFGSRCRFHPTCSQYAIDALTRFGALRGTYLAVRRVLRCHPWHAGGMDPVPPAFAWRRRRAEERTTARSGV